VAEADEYAVEPGFDNSARFLSQNPDILLITNIDFDHPDIYPNITSVIEVYTQFAQRLQGLKTLILNGDDKNSLELREKYPQAITYGFSPGSMYQIERRTTARLHNTFCLHYKGESVGEFVVKVPGIHNIMNAAGALIAAYYAGVPFEEGARNLEIFEGVARRFEYLGTLGGVDCFDDYAHHPHEIEATLGGIAEWYASKKIIAVFQSHTYSRTQSLLSEFGSAFTNATKVRILPIYASAREKLKSISGNDLVQEIAKHHPDVAFWESTQELKQSIIKIIDENSVIVFMGAGDIGVKARKCLDTKYNT